jgi:hypothetical protein
MRSLSNVMAWILIGERKKKQSETDVMTETEFK